MAQREWRNTLLGKIKSKPSAAWAIQYGRLHRMQLRATDNSRTTREQVAARLGVTLGG